MTLVCKMIRIKAGFAIMCIVSIMVSMCLRKFPQLQFRVEISNASTPMVVNASNQSSGVKDEVKADKNTEINSDPSSGADVEKQTTLLEIKEEEVAVLGKISTRKRQSRFRAVLSTLHSPEWNITVHNPNNKAHYSVTVVSHGKYTGTARLITSSSSKVVYLWEPRFPGQFEVLVHEIINDISYLIQPSPFHIRVKAENGATGLFQGNSTTKLVSCQQLTRADTFAAWDGAWIGPDFDGGGDEIRDNQIRTGWSFLPSRQMNCLLETFSTSDLHLIPDKKSIYILGTSRERGIFLSLVDLLLSNEEKEYLTQSVIGKCWGRAMVKKGNLELLYQDWRVSEFRKRDLIKKSTECHNDKIAMEAGNQFISNATYVWEELFEDERAWPTVIYLLTPFDLKNFDFGDHIQAFVSMLPPSWIGTLFLGDVTFSARRAGMVDIKTYKYYLNQLKEMTSRLNDNRIRWIDGIGISKEMRMYGEGGEGKIASSQHFHHACNEMDKEMRVCSNITEMTGQLLLGHALGPKNMFHKKVEQQSRKDKDRDLSVTYCHNCPQNILPFHILPYPKMTCVEGPLKEKSKRENTDWTKNSICPCLDQHPNSTLKTESDVVDVRYCTT